MLFAWLHSWLSGKTDIGPTVSGKCSAHRTQFSVAIPKPQPFELRQEYVIPSGRRLDIALLNSDGRVIMGFEVRSKHPITAEKAENLPARWVELRASSIARAFEPMMTGGNPPPIDLLRWAEYDRPPCCKRPGTSFGYGRFGVVTPRPSTSKSVYIHEPVQREATDADMLSAATFYDCLVEVEPAPGA